MKNYNAMKEKATTNVGTQAGNRDMKDPLFRCFVMD
jgi:hypothetical protein